MRACVCVFSFAREVERQTQWENDWGEGIQADKETSQGVKMYSGCVIEAMC